MRHRKKGKILDRASAPRRALLKNLASSLVLYERIRTTNAKAKAVRSYVERLITIGKAKTLHSRRELLKKLTTASAVEKVLAELSPRYKERAGGYTRIIKLGRRVGDAAEMVLIEFV